MITILKILLIGCAFMTFIWVSIYLFKSKRYEEDLIYLTYFIKDGKVTFENYQIIMSEFQSLSYNNRDPFRTNQVWGWFVKKYEPVIHANVLSSDDLAEEHFRVRSIIYL